jgi:hypothetical protein
LYHLVKFRRIPLMLKPHVKISLRNLEDLADQIGPSQALAMSVLNTLKSSKDPRKVLSVPEIVSLGLEGTDDAETLAQHLPPEWLE